MRCSCGGAAAAPSTTSEDLAEDADDTVAVRQRHRADLDRESERRRLSTSATEASFPWSVPREPAGEHLACTTVFLGVTTDVNWRPRTSPTSRRPASLTQSG